MEKLNHFIAGVLLGVFVYAGALYFTTESKECRVNIHGISGNTVTYIGVEHEPI